MSSFNNIMLLTDSYKISHAKQYPYGTEHVFSYFESRGGKFDHVVFFGLQYFLKEYLRGDRVWIDEIDEAEKIWNEHMGPGMFPRRLWEYIHREHGGELPVSIKAVPEGSVVPVHNVLMTVENTDPNCYWLTNFLETLLSQVWYSSTVATLSREVKKVINFYLEKNGNQEGLPFKFHDFGFRGVSSVESAALGGCAHLVNFMGSDTIAAEVMARNYYRSERNSFSIPASEHSTITSWGKEHELDAFNNMLEQFPEGLVACVSDSYDIYKACSEYWGTALKDEVMDRKGTLVIRPDSGNPTEVVPKVMNILGEKFGYTRNQKGFKVLPDQVRVIQGDGVDLDMVNAILAELHINEWSADNIAFGCGGALLQKLNRDTQKFAFKCSSVTVSGEERDVYKQPVTDLGKQSKKGRLALMLDENGHYVTVNEKDCPPGQNQLVEVFRDGKLLVDQKFQDIRDRARI